MKARGSRQQASGIADWGRCSDQDDLLDATVCAAADDCASVLHHSVSSDSELSQLSTSEEEEIVMEKTDGQFDTIKRRKKKRTAPSAHDLIEIHPIEKTVPAISDDHAHAAAEPLATAPVASPQVPPPLEPVAPVSLILKSLESITLLKFFQIIQFFLFYFYFILQYH